MPDFRARRAFCSALLVLSPQLGLSAKAGAAGTDLRDLTQLSLTELANVEVSAVSRQARPLTESPAAVHVINAEDLRRAGVTSLADALALAPGVEVGRIDSNKWAVGVRGFSGRLASAQLVLIDGRSVYDPLFAGTYWEVQDTVLDDVERIEVVRGPGGTLWGSNAVNGIINIVTKPASQTQGGLVSLGGGTEELYGDGRFGGPLGSKGAYRAYLKGFDRDASWHPDGSSYDAWHMVQGGFRSDFAPSSEQRLTLQGDLYRGKAGQRGSVTSYVEPYVRVVDQDARLSGGNFLGRWVRNGLTVQSYYDRTNRDEPTFGEVRNTFDVDLQDQVGSFGRHTLVLGAGYRYSAGDTQGSDSIRVKPPDRADYVAAGFIVDSVSLANKRARLEVGAKFEHNSFTGFEVQPSIRAIWLLGPSHSLWAAASRAVRTPSRFEQDVDVTLGAGPTTPLFLRLLGNPDYEAEVLHAYEAGYRTDLGHNVLFDLAAFHGRYQKLLGAVPGTVSQEPGRLVISVTTANALEASSWGAEASITAHLAPGWLLQGDYSYLSLNLERTPGSNSFTTGADEEGSSPRHQLHLRSALKLHRTVELSAAFRWVDALPAQHVPAYSELDARLAWSPVSRVELGLAGRNLLKPRHAEFGGNRVETSQIERAVLASLRLNW